MTTMMMLQHRRMLIKTMASVCHSINQQTFYQLSKSPQRKQPWFKQLEDSFRETNSKERQCKNMLVINTPDDEYILFPYPYLVNEVLKTISLVASWLKAFCSATTEMSRTKEPMLSTVHAIFWGLKEHVHSTLAELHDSAPTELKDGLVEAHQKLMIVTSIEGDRVFLDQ
ncbi:hypothetical protein BYT27DRAFT_7217833 [Phlegmacium glaucopus]|nr:hypothetical protein BYT27DRAFT_7217833 [Phlegmacium glaucopus]